MRSVFLLAAGAALAAVAFAGPVEGAEFIRGDANGDGVVSISDAHYLFNFLFRVGDYPECGFAADVNDDGQINITDAIELCVFTVRGVPVPKPPFPAPGLDPEGTEPGPNLPPCDSYGSGRPVEDASASLRVLDELVPGGQEAGAVIRLSISSSRRIAGYGATIAPGGIVLRPNPGASSTANGFPVSDLSGTLALGYAEAVYYEAEDAIRAGFLSTFIGDVATPPGKSRPALEISVCLRAGTPAGSYPITLEAAELADHESGQRIIPEIASGILTILEDVVGADCILERRDPRRPDLLDVTFKLEDAAGCPGSEVEIPFLVRVSDQAVADGLRFAIGFDAEVLEFLAVETVLPRPDGQPWIRLYPPGWRHHPDLAPLPPDVVLGEYRYGAAFPANEEFTALALRFRVLPEAAPTVAEIRFLPDGATMCTKYDTPGMRSGVCYPFKNAVYSAAAALDPQFVNSFVFVNGRVNIVPDVTVFIRGDTNDDKAIDLTDALIVLGYLFKGETRPSCFDAADANDDGRIDISDPVSILAYLFLGGPPMPPPNEVPGEDPTPDEITCSYGGRG